MKLIFTILASVVLSMSVITANNADNKKVIDKKADAKVEQAAAIAEVNGAVIDLKTNEALAGAAILIDGAKIYSDLDGNFVLKNVKPGVHKVKVELISYETADLEINVKENSNVNIPLMQK